MQRERRGGANPTWLYAKKLYYDVLNFFEIAYQNKVVRKDNFLCYVGFKSK